MKKGSKLLKCASCGKHIAWRIPVKNWGLFMEVKDKDICHWQYVKVDGVNRRLCDECKSRIEKGGAE